MIEKYKNEIVIDVYRGDNEELTSTIEEIRAYSKTYEYDKVTVVDLKKSVADSKDKEQYIVTLEIERDISNLGRKYKYEEGKLFGFYEDEEE
ncbi:hypothetical protein AAIE21_11040 [Paenibacillus sp. 102]|uniref:hypothetical protein n=1 Tax=Paenibacillus sp. 102 TaxID=3120823 RepID=UPI0031BA324A